MYLCTSDSVKTSRHIDSVIPCLPSSSLFPYTFSVLFLPLTSDANQHVAHMLSSVLIIQPHDLTHLVRAKLMDGIKFVSTSLLHTTYRGCVSLMSECFPQVHASKKNLQWGHSMSNQRKKILTLINLNKTCFLHSVC